MKERLARRLLWWRHYYTFTFAHHPLCERHRPDVLHIGSVHVCRSCALLWLGVATSPIALGNPLVWLHVVLWPVLVLSIPDVYARLHRRVRDAARFGAGFAGGATALVVITTLTTEPVLAVLHAAGVVALHRIYARARARRSDRICAGCPELDAGGVCSGFRHQYERARAFEDAIYARLPETPPKIDGARR